MHAAVFLDRDNTLIANDGDLGDPDLVRLIDGVPEGLKALHEAGYRLVVVTNQGGVARGLYSERDVDAVHRRIVGEIERAGLGEAFIDRFYYCPFHPEGTVPEYRREHPWRKPGAGMLLQAAVDLDLDLARSWLIGDQPRDILAGQAAGCRTVLLSSSAAPSADARPTATATTFADAVQEILRASPAGHAPAAASRKSAAGGGDGDASSSTALATSLAEAKPRTKPLARVAPPAAEGDAGGAALRRAIRDLTDELRTRRQRETEFTAMRMTAGIMQLLVLLLALLGLLQLNSPQIFMQWMVGALLLQLLVLTLLVADARG